MPSGAHFNRDRGGSRMHSVGIDLHRSRSHVAIIDGEGDVLLWRRIVNDPATFLELLGEIDGECRIALEATFGWGWLADVLRGAGYELHLAHPLRTKAIASRAGEDRRGRRQDARASAAQQPAARGLYRSTGAAGAARSLA